MSPTNNLPEPENPPPHQPNPNVTPPSCNISQAINPKPNPSRQQHQLQNNPYQNHHYQSRNDLTHWLQQAQQTTPTNTKNPIPPPTTMTIEQPQQQNLLPSSDNHPWGDKLLLQGPEHSFQVLSHNVNTLSPAKDFLKWWAAAQAIYNYSITMACLQETNLQWSTPITKCISQIFCKLPPKQSKIAISNSSDITTSNYQPGRTCTALLGKWTALAKLSSQDPSGMGWWSFIEMEGKEAHCIIILTGYWSCNQNSRLGLATYHDQQIQILLSQGQVDPDPQTTFIDKIIHQIWQWHQQKKVVLICLDANKNVINPNLTQGIGRRLLAETDLIDLHHHHYPQHPQPATYNHGHSTIDICLGSPKFVTAMMAATILPFDIPIQLLGDHHALIMEFDSCILFGHQPPPLCYLYVGGSELCPMCSRDPEDDWHFLECPHLTWRELFSKLKQQLAVLTSKHSLHPSILTTFWLGLLTIRHDTPYPDIQDDLPPILHDTIWHQSQLGWDQLYQGRISHSWAKAIDQLNPHLLTTGCQILTQMLQVVWAYILVTWMTWNQHLHQDAGHLSLPNYQQAVATLYERGPQLPPDVRVALFCTPLQQMLEQPPAVLRQWLEHSHQYIKQQMKAAKKQATINTHDIHSFFWCTASANDLQPLWTTLLHCTSVGLLCMVQS